MAQDDPEEIVEVVGNAAGQSAQRLKLLRLEELFLEHPKVVIRLFPFGDVFGQSSDADDGTLVVVNRKSRVANPTQRSVGSLNAIFDVVGAPSLFGQGRLHHALAVGWNNRLDPLDRMIEQRLTGAPPNGFIGGTDVKYVLLDHIGQPERTANAFRQLAEPRLAFFQSLQSGEPLLFALRDLNGKPEVVREALQQFHLGFLKEVRLGGIEAKDAPRRSIDQQREGSHRRKAEFQRRIAPRDHSRVLRNAQRSRR